MDVKKSAEFIKNTDQSLQEQKDIEKRFCTECGALLQDDAFFCTSCGNPIGNRKSDLQEGKKEESEKEHQTEVKTEKSIDVYEQENMKESKKQSSVPAFQKAVSGDTKKKEVSESLEIEKKVPVFSEIFQTPEIEEEEEPVFAKGLPEWNVLPPDIPVGSVK